MIYYNDDNITIRDLAETDAQYFADEEMKQGWNSTPEKLLMQLKDAADGKCTALAADYMGEPAGYIHLYFEPEGAFAGTGFPEIVDFNVLQKFQKRGIGSKLMDIAEKLAAERSDTVCLGVGLHNGYGSAQRMYVKRGYIPDGTGVWYNGKPCTPYDTIYTNNDDLVLYMSKKLDYSYEKFPRPSVAVDCALFGLESVPPEKRSQLDTKKLKILLVKRGSAPHEGMFALPGGFLRENETVEHALLREMDEETGIKDELKTINLGIYSKVGRDERGWIISCAFLALTNKVELCSSAQSDAAEARWFDFDFAENKDGAVILLRDGADSIRLDYKNGESCGEQALAFDHAQIIYDAFLKLREEVVIHDLIFPLLPPLFTIADLQQPYELITGIQTSPANFRRKMMNKITETNETAAAISHRPAKLYRVRTDDENIREE